MQGSTGIDRLPGQVNLVFWQVKVEMNLPVGQVKY